MNHCRSDLVSRSRWGHRQMLVCYEPILTGESRGIFSEASRKDARGRPLLEKREKWRTPGQHHGQLDCTYLSEMWATRLTVDTNA